MLILGAGGMDQKALLAASIHFSIPPGFKLKEYLKST
jgi:hypothetical protein